MTDPKRGRAIGIGGLFFRSKNPEKLAGWYAENLDIQVESWGDTYGASFPPKDMPANSFAVWSIFKSDTKYFGPSGQSFMFNLVVDDLDAALERVVAGGAKRLPGLEEQDFGRFGWFIDPDGNRVELWEPPAETG
jgi:predicted enzyme related to lactoylglutathione lyase